MRKVTLRLLLFVLMMLTVNSFESAAQVVELKLQSTPDGFFGEYKEEGTTLFTELYTSNDYSVSRIQTSDKQTIVESVRDKNIVTVKISDTTLTFYIDQEALEGKKTTSLSESDEQNLEGFSTSKKSAPVRRLIAELIKQRATNEAERLKGFVVIAMVLGDGPGAPDNLQAKANCKSPKLVQMYASYRPQNQPKAMQSKLAQRNNNSTVNNLCYGCCGPGCWGCTGCYTAACAEHDYCVERYGYTSRTCLYYLSRAIASMYWQC